MGTFATVNVINATGYSAIESIAGNVMTITIYIQAVTSIVTTSGSPQSATVTTAFAAPLVATVLDQHGFPMTGITVTFTAPAAGVNPTGVFSNSTNTITGTTNASGQLPETFTANTHAGSYTVNATVGGVATPATFSLTNTAGAAASIVVASGSPQSAAVATSFAPLVVTVDDAYGNPVPAAAVTFTAPASGVSGKFSNSTNTIGSSTNASGQLSEAFTANTLPGSYSVTATVAGVGTPASFSLTNTAGAPYSITLTSGSGQTATVNTAFTNPLLVTVYDQYNNLVPAPR